MTLPLRIQRIAGIAYHQHYSLAYDKLPRPVVAETRHDIVPEPELTAELETCQRLPPRQMMRGVAVHARIVHRPLVPRFEAPKIPHRNAQLEQAICEPCRPAGKFGRDD